MDLRSRLELYKKTIEKAPAIKVKNTAREIDILVPGSVCTNEQGSCYVIENVYPSSYRYGGANLGEALKSDSDTLSALGGTGCEDLSADKLLFLDTETTGLSGGAGTVAFLVGVGFFEGETFTVRQYFIRDYDEEEAMLKELHQLFNRYQGFVTFNGKSFDINLLQSRFISNRLKPSFRDLPNLDLLYPSRRIWGLKLENCRLASLEENVLGEYRADDIPGAQIPSVYFKYLDDRDASDIKRVIRHNGLDILSMVSLLARLSSLLKDPLSEADGGFELLGLGRIFEATGRMDTMLECFEACTGSDRYTIRSQAVKRLTGVYKKNGSYDLALEHWKRMESEDSGFELFHLVEMAKYYEHKAKDIEFALVLVNKAIQKCLDAGLQHSKQYDDLKRRRDRLMKKSCSAMRESNRDTI
ncbi:MAG: ribonuclease H-like domain-containing protein [Clostridiaceae bacterium]